MGNLCLGGSAGDNRAVGRICEVGQLCVNEVDVKDIVVRAKYLATTLVKNIPRPLLAVNQRRNLDTVQ